MITWTVRLPNGRCAVMAGSEHSPPPTFERTIFEPFVRDWWHWARGAINDIPARREVYHLSTFRLSAHWATYTRDRPEIVIDLDATEQLERHAGFARSYGMSEREVLEFVQVGWTGRTETGRMNARTFSERYRERCIPEPTPPSDVEVLAPPNPNLPTYRPR